MQFTDFKLKSDKFSISKFLNVLYSYSLSHENVLIIPELSPENKIPFFVYKHVILVFH